MSSTAVAHFRLGLVLITNCISAPSFMSSHVRYDLLYFFPLSSTWLTYTAFLLQFFVATLMCFPFDIVTSMAGNAGEAML